MGLRVQDQPSRLQAVVVLQVGEQAAQSGRHVMGHLQGFALGIAELRPGQRQVDHRRDATETRHHLPAHRLRETRPDAGLRLHAACGLAQFAEQFVALGLVLRAAQHADQPALRILQRLGP
ncbi:hypothetical protein D3C76_861080 [compost metagenome]